MAGTRLVGLGTRLKPILRNRLWTSYRRREKDKHSRNADHRHGTNSNSAKNPACKPQPVPGSSFPGGKRFPQVIAGPQMLPETALQQCRYQRVRSAGAVVPRGYFVSRNACPQSIWRPHTGETGRDSRAEHWKKEPLGEPRLTPILVLTPVLIRILVLILLPK